MASWALEEAGPFFCGPRRLESASALARRAAFAVRQHNVYFMRSVRKLPDTTLRLAGLHQQGRTYNTHVPAARASIVACSQTGWRKRAVISAAAGQNSQSQFPFGYLYLAVCFGLLCSKLGCSKSEFRSLVHVVSSPFWANDSVAGSSSCGRTHTQVASLDQSCYITKSSEQCRHMRYLHTHIY